MSQIFHKSCYTSRTSGYKYRTLSTNTGEKKRKDSKEESTLDRKFKEIKREITKRIDKEVDSMQTARDSIQEKFEKIDTKINSMLELQDTVLNLRSDLSAAENTLGQIILKVCHLEMLSSSNAPISLYSRRSFEPPIFEVIETVPSETNI